MTLTRAETCISFSLGLYDFSRFIPAAGIGCMFSLACLLVWCFVAGDVFPAFHKDSAFSYLAMGKCFRTLYTAIEVSRTHLHPFCSKFNFYIVWNGRGEVAGFFYITFIDLHCSCTSTLSYSFRFLILYACYVFPRRAHRVGNWSHVFSSSSAELSMAFAL